jgi:RNA 2',3'-cyclic 3'-phosphodiesterase
MRLFVAIDLDPEIRSRIATFLDGVRGFAPEARWVSAQSLHITLKFIGESQRLEEIKSSLALVNGKATQLSFRGTGFFPNPRAARVFWVDIGADEDADENLPALAGCIDLELEKVGIEKEERAYTPHLTLARGGGRRSPGQSNNRFQKLVEQLNKRPAPDFGTMTAREFFLYQSKTAPSGAVYAKLARYELK